jgi:hypothetical protein
VCRRQVQECDRIQRLRRLPCTLLLGIRKHHDCKLHLQRRVSGAGRRTVYTLRLGHVQSSHWIYAVYDLPTRQTFKGHRSNQ